MSSGRRLAAACRCGCCESHPGAGEEGHPLLQCAVLSLSWLQGAVPTASSGRRLTAACRCRCCESHLGAAEEGHPLLQCAMLSLLWLQGAVPTASSGRRLMAACRCRCCESHLGAQMAPKEEEEGGGASQAPSFLRTRVRPPGTQRCGYITSILTSTNLFCFEEHLQSICTFDLESIRFNQDLYIDLSLVMW